MNSESIGGTYFRVADANWSDPVDASYAALGNGQRWNPAGVPCLYLHADWQTANANLQRKIGIHPFRSPILFRQTPTERPHHRYSLPAFRVDI